MNEVRQIPQWLHDRREDLITAATAGPRVVRSWRITGGSDLYLPESTFDPRAAAAFAEDNRDERFYCVARRDGEARAAVLFRPSTSESSIVIEELALAHVPGNRDAADPLATIAAVLLLDRLHGLAVTYDLSTDLWAASCYGASHEQLISLGFRHIGDRDGGRAYLRHDREDRGHHPGRGLELMRAWHRFRDARP